MILPLQRMVLRGRSWIKYVADRGATDLDKTFKRIHSYLKKDGEFVFSWSHPIHKCVSVENGKFVFSNSYFNEDWYCADMRDKEIMLSNRMLSTYINALAGSGFVMEQLIEATDKELAGNATSDFGRKAMMLPTAFVIKARKVACVPDGEMI